ncbi:valine--pyruvate transaminase [Candidatus Marinamargulisbacteria bacterium SCGC AG-343-D04]|nr:valine--pyruvate transaminase [Candidatus Marinamargulisbacteria bacterium SCGC AG-343-D04]
MDVSEIGKKITQLTGVRAIMADIKESLGAGKSFINLSAGNPLVIPEIGELWKSSLSKIMETPDFDSIIGRYGDSQGYQPFVGVVKDYFRQRYQWDISERNILITPGSQAGIFYGTNMFCDQSQPLLLPLNPDYTGYKSSWVSLEDPLTVVPNTSIVSPHTFKYQVDVSRIRQILTQKKVGAMAFSRPSNPTGNVLEDDVFHEFASMAKEYDFPIFVDSAYSEPFPGITDVSVDMSLYPNMVYSFSLSKCGLPGERMGVLVGDEAVIDKLECFQSNATIHSSRLGQAIAADVLTEYDFESMCQRYLKDLYFKKRQCVEDVLTHVLGDLDWYLHVHQGGLFSWLWVPQLKRTDLELYAEAKEKGVLVVPGSMFFHNAESISNKELLNCFRISLTATDEDIRSGVQIFAETIKDHLS